MDTVLQKARTFLYRNARPLDIARWQYHFEGGSRAAVLTALSAYQNEDGGFGHALEPDAWNPNSSPVQTWAATEILREIGWTDRTHPLVSGILRYLASGQDFDGHVWACTIGSNNDYPHAPWWHSESESACNSDYNPTACLAGFILRFAEKDSDLYRLGCRAAKEAFAAFAARGLLDDMHTAACYIRLWEYGKEAGAAELLDAAAMEQKLRGQVKHGITQNTAEWANGYVCRPSQFFASRSSVFYADNKAIADYECTHIRETQLADGSWDIPWSWSAYDAEWAISKNWWKGSGVVLNLLYLKGLDG